MSRASIIAAGRREALAGMTDTWTITRKTEDWPSGATAPTIAATTIYSGPGKLQSFESYEQTPIVGSHESTVMRPMLHLPVTSTSALVKVDDIATCTASTADASLVGTKVTIQGVQSKTYMTARRFPVSEVID